MKQRSSLGVTLATVVFFLLSGLMLIALMGALDSARAYPYVPESFEVTGAQAQWAENGCLVTLQVRNTGSRDADVGARSFYFYTGDHRSVNAAGNTAVDYNNPLADAFHTILPAGRSGSVSLLLDLPADAGGLTVTWYNADAAQQLEISLP